MSTDIVENLVKLYLGPPHSLLIHKPYRRGRNCSEIHFKIGDSTYTFKVALLATLKLSVAFFKNHFPFKL